MKPRLIKKTKTIALSIYMVFCFFPSIAQKSEFKVTEEMTNKIIEITKPVKEQVDKLLEQDATGTYKAYKEEVTNLNNLKNVSDKNELTAKIKERYTEFFTGIWDAANINEKEYQQKIRDAFPNGWGENVEFQSFLNFTFKSSNNKKNTPPPSQPPLPENKCIDVCTITTGRIGGSAKLIGGGGGSFGNCFLKSNGWSAALGKNELAGYLHNNIRIPGTFPSDTRTLRILKTYDLSQQAISFALLGFGYSETWMRTYMSYEYMFVMSPVIFMATRFSSKTMQEEYLLPKPDISQSVFKTYAVAFAYMLSGNWCYTECNNIKWSVCEEGK